MCLKEFAGPLAQDMLDLQLGSGVTFNPEYAESKRSALGPNETGRFIKRIVMYISPNSFLFGK